MLDVLSKAKSPIRFDCLRSDSARRSSITSSATWVVCLLLAVLHLTGCGITYNTLPLTISPSSVSFGSVPVGTTQATAVTLKNLGFSPVTLSGMQAADPAFHLASDQMNATIPGGGTATLNVTFAPTEVKSYSSQITIVSGGKQSAFSVSGNGQQTSPTSPAAATPALQVSATTLQFGSVPIGGNAQQSLTLTSSGNAPLEISALNAAGDSFSAQMPSLPLTLQPGQTLTLPVEFDPKASGAETGHLVIASNAVAAPSVTVALVGNGATSAPPPPSGTPVLTLSSVAVDFGSVAVGSQGSKSVTLTSSGTAAVVLQSIAVNGEAFSAGQLQLPLTLAPGQQIALPLSFAPSTGGAKQGEVTLTDNATGSPSAITLNGNGTATASLSAPPDVEFGDVTVGAQGDKTITLVSDGTAPVTVNSITVVGASFSSATQVLPQVLQPNQQMSLKLKFDPKAEGDATGTVTISSNSGSGATTLVKTHGKGVNANTSSLSASASSLNFGQVLLGSQATKTLTVTSTGTGAATITGASVGGTGYTATYAGVPIQNLSTPITLQPGQAVTFDVAFRPKATGGSAGQLSFTTNTGSPVNVSLAGKGQQGTSPALTINPTGLNFGSVQMGSKAVLQVALTSSGTAPVTISSSAIAGQEFQIASVTYPAGTNSWPVTLNPGQQIILSIAFNPDSVNSFTGDLALASNASGGTANVPLSGTGDAVPVPNLTLSATSIDFGQTAIGSKVSRKLTLTSTGNAPLDINTITVSDPQFTVAALSLPATLQPGQQLPVTVTFDPTSEATSTGTLTVTSNDNSGPATVSLGGSGTAVPTAQLTVNPTAVNFGNVPLNTASTQPVTVTSTGAAPLTISAAAATGAGFSVSGATFPVTLNQNQSVTLQARFNPSTAGTASGQLTLTSNSTNGTTTVVSLSGVGSTAVTTPQLLFSSTTLSFGNVPVGSTGTLSLTLTSSGTAPVTISSAVLQGTGFSDSGASFPATLNPNQSVTLKLQFDPTTTGAATGTLTVSSNSTTGGTTQVTLSGTGTAVPHEIDLTWDAPSSSADPVAGYNVYRSTNGGGSFTKLNSSPNSQVAYTDSAVQSGNTYTYEIKSVDANGVESTPSNEISLTVP